jgi:hypothetical protein
MVCADIEPANIVTHDDNNVRFLPGGSRCRCRLLRMRRTCQPNGGECRGGYQRATAQQEVATFQSCAARLAVGLELFWSLIFAHDAILFLAMHLKTDMVR